MRIGRIEIFDPGTPTNPNDDVIICNAGAYLRKYCNIDLVYKNKNLLHHAVSVTELSVTPAQKAAQTHIQKIIDDAHHLVDDYAQTYLTQIDKDMERKNDTSGASLLSKAGAKVFPKVPTYLSPTEVQSVKICTKEIEIRIHDVISILPFEN